MQNCMPETKEEYKEKTVDKVKAVRTHVLIERNIETRIMMLCFNRRKTKKCSHNALNILNTGYTLNFTHWICALRAQNVQ